MERLVKKSCEDFLKVLASKEPVPGGGGAAALAGAIGAALTSMVANLTIDKKGYEEVQEQINLVLTAAEVLRSKMLALVTADAAVFGKFMACYKMPKVTEEEKKIRAESIQVAAYDAAEVPLAIAQACMEVLEIAAQVVKIGNKTAITDATVAAFLARAALRSACYNVQSNLLLIKDAEYVTKTEAYLLKLNHEALDLEELVVVETDIAMGPSKWQGQTYRG